MPAAPCSAAACASASEPNASPQLVPVGPVQTLGSRRHHADTAIHAMAASAARTAGARTAHGAARRRARGAGRPGAGSRAGRVDCRHRRHGGDLGPAHPGDGAHRKPAPALERRGHDARRPRARSLRSVRRRARVFGAQLVRQRSAAGVESVFGTSHPDIAIATTPALSTERRGGPRRRASPARAADRARGSRNWSCCRARRHLPPDLAVAGRAPAATSSRCSSTRRPATRSSATRLIQTQSAVGTGPGVLGDRKKLSTRQAVGVFLADDTAAPAVAYHLDLRGNLTARARHPQRLHQPGAVATSPATPTTPGPRRRTSTRTSTSAGPTTTTSSASAAAASTATTARSARSCTRRRAPIRCRCQR